MSERSSAWWFGKWKRKARKAISPPEASPGRGLGKIRPSTRYEATARRVAALRRTAVASLRASVNRGDESAFFVPSARASLVAKRGYYGVADEVVREQQRQITELAAAVRALRAEIAAAGGGGANGGGGVRADGTGELLAAVAVDVPARGSPESPPNKAPKYGGSDADPADVEAEADAEEERTKESEVVKPEESSDDEGPEVELKTPSPEPELTEKERRRLEKLARKETKRAEREEKKAEREEKKAERVEKKAKRVEKKSLRSRDRAADDDEPVFEDDSVDVSEDAPTPSPEPTIAPKMSKERKPRVTAEMEAEHLDDVECKCRIHAQPLLTGLPHRLVSEQHPPPRTSVGPVARTALPLHRAVAGERACTLFPMESYDPRVPCVSYRRVAGVCARPSPQPEAPWAAAWLRSTGSASSSSSSSVSAVGAAGVLCEHIGLLWRRPILRRHAGGPRQLCDCL